MSLKNYTVAAMAVGAMFVLVVKVFYDTASKDNGLRVLELDSGTGTGQTQNLVRIMMQQRNNVSRQLNDKQRKVGQLECDKLGDKGAATSETGGWCLKSSKENSGNHMTDMKLVAALTEFFKGKYVGSFGDGPGRYKQLLTDSGKLKGYDAYDGAPYCETTSEGRVKFLDLTLPQYGLPVYDWIMSLEVAEHIPQTFENVYIDNIVRHAKEGVVISWARPGQGGYQHINNRPFDYVKTLMESLGFTHDEVESQKLKEAASFDWFKHNTNVFRRKQSLTEEIMKTLS